MKWLLSLLVAFFLFISLTFSQDEHVIEFQIHPNPTNGIVNIEIRRFDPNASTYFNDMDIEVYNSTGQLILKRPYHLVSGYSSTISDSFYLTEYPSGIYLVKLNAYGKLFVSRLILLK